jgi:hypothetical protein
MPPTNKIYDMFVKKARVLPQTVDLGHGAQGHWVGDRNADNVLVWYHGTPPTARHFIQPD